MERTKNKIKLFLIGSLFALLFLCVILFTCQAIYMTNANKETITRVVNLYMEESSEQLKRHFTTLFHNRIIQVRGIMEDIPFARLDNLDDTLRASLTQMAKSRGFTYMGLHSDTGDEFLICGESISIDRKDAFINAARGGSPVVAVGKGRDGSQLLLYGISLGRAQTRYTLPDGSDCTILIVGIPLQRLNEALDLGRNHCLIYSHIIRRDGSFVVRNADAQGRNYFEWLHEAATFEELSAEAALGSLRTAAQYGTNWSAVLSVHGEQRHVFCSPMENTRWALVTVLPHGELDNAISELGNKRMLVSMAACAVLLVATICIFVLYMKVALRQIKETELAKQRAEEARMDAEHASLAKSEFLSNMSHDIRTPMNAIVGMTAIALKNLDNTERVRDCLQKVSRSGRHLLGLINDILDMSKIESGKLNLNMCTVNLRDIVEGLVTIMQPQVKARNQSFNISVGTVLTEQVICDDVRLNQILINLLSNATKFTPEGGGIRVSLLQEASPRGEDFVRTHFWVQDDGIGMTAEFREKIFESFTRADSRRVHRTEGTGLGMAITKYLVDKMKGLIEVESEPGKGSTFHVVLDFERADNTETDMLLPSWRMLVVDDDQQLCQDAASSLEELGITVESATSGAAAVHMVEEREKTGHDYQVVLIDWKMPDMDGIATANLIRKKVGDHVPILLISAYDWSDFEDEARKAGVNGFIAKPLFKSSLYHGLAPFVNENRQLLPEREEDDFSGVRLLVAEDNEINWEIANLLLSEKGFDVDWAENGKRCLEMFLQTEPWYYKIILMDLRMPKMDGYEATRAIRNCEGRPDGKLIPIVAMTADAFAEDINQCLKCGMNDHIAKPFNMDEVIETIKKFLHKTP